MAGLVSEAQRLIQYGGGIADVDAALARLNDRATYMRQHVAVVLAERCPARRQMNLSGSTAQVIDFIQSH